MTLWNIEGGAATFPGGEAGWTAEVRQDGALITVRDRNGRTEPRLATGDAYPAAPLAIRRDGRWVALGQPDGMTTDAERVVLAWGELGAELTVTADPALGLRLALVARGADATAIGWLANPDEHFYGMGERFNKLDQRGEIVELWVKNGASGGDTYKPVPFVASSRGYGVAVETSRRLFMALAHPTTPDVATVTVEGDELTAWLIPGETPVETLARYTAWVGRPPVPPEWFFRPWKSRDWRIEDQGTVLEDIAKHREHGIPCGVKLIDALWETETHSFAFDEEKYPDVDGMVETLREAGMTLVLWISPSMTAGTEVYDECARRGFLITDADGQPYVHRLGNEPGWEGTTFDFTNPEAVAWWQAHIRTLMDRGVKGFKTDFGEQVPEDAHFANGKTGVEMHNLLPVIYNEATWEVVREYDGVLLARSAWAGSQPFPGIWAGDQSPDFSPWGGLPTVIVAGQSAGWSGFPYWGSDVGGYFNAPDDEVFARWAQFGAVSPVMEAHGLGSREPWEFSDQTLAIYREAALLHDQLVPYSLAAAAEARETGIPIMRAMALIHPDSPEAHEDWVQYQFYYGPHLLAAPVYSWGKSRQVWFPTGTWIDIETGEAHVGPTVTRVPAPLEKLPLFARAGAAIPLRMDPAQEELTIRLFAHPDATASRLTLLGGAELTCEPAERGGSRLTVAGPDRPYRLTLPFQAEWTATSDDADVTTGPDGVAWVGPATLTITMGTTA